MPLPYSSPGTRYDPPVLYDSVWVWTPLGYTASGYGYDLAIRYDGATMPEFGGHIFRSPNYSPILSSPTDPQS